MPLFPVHLLCFVFVISHAEKHHGVVTSEFDMLSSTTGRIQTNSPNLYSIPKAFISGLEGFFSYRDWFESCFRIKKEGMGV